MKTIPSGKTLGVVNILLGALMFFGGLEEAIGYFGEQPVNVIVGLLGAAAGAAFLISGLALWRQQSYARPLTAIACVAVIVTHLAAWQFRFLGVLAILLAIIYPALVLLSLWRTRRDALRTEQRDAASSRSERKGGLLKRVALNHTT